MMPTLRSVVCADTVAAWTRAGFALAAGSANEVVVGDVRFTLTGAAEPTAAAAKDVKGFTGWTWSGVSREGDVGGVPTAIVDPDQPLLEAGKHPNGVVSVDHLVLRTGDIGATKRDLEDAGLELRREASDIYPGITQLFYRPGSPAGNGVILEVVGPTEGASTEAVAAPFLWGVTFVSDDIDATKERLGDGLGSVRPAKQAGRRISTLRHEDFGMTVAVAIMDPHQAKSRM